MFTQTQVNVLVVRNGDSTVIFSATIYLVLCNAEVDNATNQYNYQRWIQDFQTRGRQPQ